MDIQEMTITLQYLFETIIAGLTLLPSLSVKG